MGTLGRMGALAGASATLGALLIGMPAAHGASAVAHCGNAELRASWRYDNTAAGHTIGYIVLRNASAHACVTGGYDGLSYVGFGNGTQVGAAAVRSGGRVASYVLAPGQRLQSLVSETSARLYSPSTCWPYRADGFRVYVPNATRSQYVPHRTTGCLNGHVQLLSHEPYGRP
ncbi:MAG: DUF4232 domain-containing protein [Actinomycetota bacterium]|nr:DUF4232 domain-containing protein [Actinomycetota bacterium]